MLAAALPIIVLVLLALLAVIIMVTTAADEPATSLSLGAVVGTTAPPTPA